ncbi:Ger(x)C family spore germination protein [Paenibacillus glufosinatiresistens]|uniref:Ger(x)C family spore germination protein n=1 Tax=Paenibacillus glufosinatiresistens TaxID=3070657 RepID=UPI00286DBDB2|nr:Ger(x)C family spore germination protein [Paenibacillus sp. YX.27]
MTGRVRICRRAALSLLLLLPCLTGCWDRHELNELALGVGLGIDKTGDGYKLTAQVVIPSEVAVNMNSSGGLPVTVYEESGPTIFEALRKMTIRSPRKVYLAHLQVVILGEELAREGVADFIDFLVRDPEVRGNFYMIVAKDTTAEQTLRILTPLERIPANKLFSSLTVSTNYYSPTSNVNMMQLLDELLAEGRDPVLTGLMITGDAKKGEEANGVKSTLPSARLVYKNLAVFRSDKLIGWLDENESKGFNYVTNQIQNSVGHIVVNGNKITTEATNSTTKIRVREVEGRPVFDIHVQNTVNLADVASPIDVTEKKNLRMIEKKAAEKIVWLMNQAIEAEKTRMHSDFLGLGRAVKQQQPALWLRLGEGWNDRLSELDIHCRADVHILLSGSSGASIKHSLEE